jgi:hypothetical protein
MLGPVYTEPSFRFTEFWNPCFGISEFHLRMRQIRRPKLYN